MTLSGIIQVTEYSDASVAMFGNTTEYKEHMKVMGGRFNTRLRHPTTKEPTPGWIFPKRSTEMLNKYVELGDTDGFDITKHCKEYGVRNSSDQDKSGVSSVEFNNLVNRVKELEQIVQRLSEKLAINNHIDTSTESNSSESNSSESKPQLRLLRRK